MIQNTKYPKAEQARCGAGRIQNTRGFSVIELVVGVVVFSVVVSASLGLFGAVLRGQRAAFAIQELQNNTRFLIEFMSKEIRTGRNFALNGNQQLSFINSDDVDITYRINGTALERSDNGGISFSTVSSDEVDIVDFAFQISEAGQAQPLITMIMEVEGAGSTPEQRTSLVIQTSVSQRYIRLIP